VDERALIFDCRADALVGILHDPGVTRHDMALLVVVGGPQYRVGSHRQFVLMARRLADAGYAVLRFDYRGMGDSSGERRTFEAVDDDIRSAIDALLLELPSARGVVLFGLCDAASAALAYSGSDPRVQGLILANPWVRTEAGEARAQVRHYYGQRLLTRVFWGKVFSGQFDVAASLGGLTSAFRRSLGTATGAAEGRAIDYIDRMLAGLDRSDRPVLLLMSERDLTAREFDDLCRNSEAWAKQLSSPKVRRFDVPEADHTFSSAATLEMATDTMLAWLRESMVERRN
jgi:exosortase A-associated hydrolase 1